MRIAVFGTGGVGGYFGGRLAASGADVHFLARGAHLAAMQSRGLRILSPPAMAHPFHAPAEAPRIMSNWKCVRSTFQTPISQAANMPPAESTRAVVTFPAYSCLAGNASPRLLIPFAAMLLYSRVGGDDELRSGSLR